MLGGRLEVLKLRGTSSTGLLLHVAALCPDLKELRVDRIRNETEISDYKSDTLRVLDVRRVSFVLPQLRLPNLSVLRYSSSSRLEPGQMEIMIASLPKVISDLTLEVCSRDADVAIAAICRYLPKLRSLTLEGSYESGSISAFAIDQLGRSCPIEELRIRSAQSITPLQLREGAFGYLCSLPQLVNAMLPYSDDVFPSLFAVLSTHRCLRSITFWERRKWLGTPKWIEIEHTLAVYAVDFPHVTLTLRDLASASGRPS
jgi:hypothetical protein